jgi:hypothetical protein
MNLSAGVDVMTKPVVGLDYVFSLESYSDSGSIRSNPKSNSYEKSEL